MIDEQQELLISAYLDDELSGDERARVEQLLATSAEASQLLEELRSLRASLKRLPPHRVDGDFATRVLAKTEPGPGTVRLERASGWDRWRGVAWAAVAIAAAVMIVVTNQPQEEERNLVRAPAQENKLVEKLARDEAGKEVEMPAVEPETVAAPKIEAPAAATARTRAEGLAQDHVGLSDAPATPPVDRLKDSQQSGSLAFSAGETSEEGLSLDGAGSDQLLVVSVDVTPDASSSDTFRQLLARHQIRADVKPMAGLQQLEDRATGGPVPRSDSRGLSLRTVEGVESRSELLQGEVVFVEATRGQIDAAIQELKQSPQSFPMVGIAGIAEKRKPPSGSPRRSEAIESYFSQSGQVGGIGGPAPTAAADGRAPEARGMPPASAPLSATPPARQMIGDDAFSAPSSGDKSGNAQIAAPMKRESARVGDAIRAVFVLRVVQPTPATSAAPSK